jgi:hypothetical protein
MTGQVGPALGLRMLEVDPSARDWAADFADVSWDTAGRVALHAEPDHDDHHSGLASDRM